MSVNPIVRITGLNPLHDGAIADWGHVSSVEYRAWAAVIGPDGRFPAPVDAAWFYLLTGMRRIGGKEEKVRPDLDQAREDGGKPATLVVNGVPYEGVELDAFMLKARAAVVDGWTVVAVVPADCEPVLTLEPGVSS